MSLTAEEADRIMRRIGKALFSRNPVQMEQALTGDAEWHCGHQGGIEAVA